MSIQHLASSVISSPTDAGDDPIRGLVPTTGRPGPRLQARSSERKAGAGRGSQPSTLEEKLHRRMVQLGMTQQALAQKSGVSDSEISRLLNGQSKRPGLHNILRLARALDVSLDFLADDQMGTEPRSNLDSLSGDEREMLDLARSIGVREVEMILDATRVLGFDLAIRRLYGLEPRIDPGQAPNEGGRF